MDPGLVPESVGEKNTLINNILLRKCNWIGHIIRRDHLSCVAIKEKMTEVIGVAVRRIQLFVV